MTASAPVFSGHWICTPNVIGNIQGSSLRLFYEPFIRPLWPFLSNVIGAEYSGRGGETEPEVANGSGSNVGNGLDDSGAVLPAIPGRCF